ncbi:hypothetical protein EVAR_29574_1 [Eumeta japonica]|uniref:Uncharacterized protein n=1 Tax=Eumeta variegata TaxID=151549 RepID=A0A4C1VT79_EUMVA|nr:hypothetical protein EVAR_29574_1 [Eumeta japonica]
MAVLREAVAPTTVGRGARGDHVLARRTDMRFFFNAESRCSGTYIKKYIWPNQNGRHSRAYLLSKYVMHMRHSLEELRALLSTAYLSHR